MSLFVMDDGNMKTPLDMLPNGYDDDFTTHAYYTTILKAHAKLNIWNNWSQLNPNHILTIALQEYGIGVSLSTILRY